MKALNKKKIALHLAAYSGLLLTVYGTYVATSAFWGYVFSEMVSS